MALSRITKVAPGGTNTFAVAFALGYGAESDITARVGAEVDGLGAPTYRTIDFSTPGFMTLSGATIAADTEVVFERTVVRDELVVDWADGANLTDDNLDNAQLQALRLIHELADGRFEELTQDLDMNGHKLYGLPEPTADDEAATKEYTDSKVAANEGALEAITLLAAQVVADRARAETAAEVAEAIGAYVDGTDEPWDLDLVVTYEDAYNA